jgi:hypothetical protein
MGSRTSLGTGVENTAISVLNRDPTPVFADQSPLCLLVPGMKTKSSKRVATDFIGCSIVVEKITALLLLLLLLNIIPMLLLRLCNC